YLKLGEIIPQALKQDFSKLSTKLSRGEKHEVETLYRMQLRTRDKLRMVLSHMYAELDVELSVSEQSQIFQEWNCLFTMLVDDLVWLVKEQQTIILKPQGLEAVVLSHPESIIPTELKSRLKEVSDFQRQFRTENYFSGNGNRQGRGRFRGRGSYQSS